MRHFIGRFFSLSSLLLMSTAAQAQDEHVVVANPGTASKTAAYWTPERFKAAKPLPAMPGDVLPTKEAAPAVQGKPEFRDGQPPARRFNVKPRRLYVPDRAQVADRASAPILTPQATGAPDFYQTHYTSTRVFPLFTGANAQFSADRAYPYITVGKLFFSLDGSPAVCSAAVIQRRIVVTSGGCVHRGSGGVNGFHSNFVFVPAYRDGTAPLMSWNWSGAAVHTAWANGGGNLRNPANYGMLEFADQPLSTGGAPVALGFVTGWLGWQTLSLDNNHTSKLGYACNLDRCEKMQNITSGGAFTLSVPNLAWYPSDALNGSDGSAWIQNFQELQVGGGSGFNAESNRVVGVTAGYLPFPGQMQVASIPDGRWIAVLNAICARRTGNCI